MCSVRSNIKISAEKIKACSRTDMLLSQSYPQFPTSPFYSPGLSAKKSLILANASSVLHKACSTIAFLYSKTLNWSANNMANTTYSKAASNSPLHNSTSIIAVKVSTFLGAPCVISCNNVRALACLFARQKLSLLAHLLPNILALIRAPHQSSLVPPHNFP